MIESLKNLTNRILLFAVPSDRRDIVEKNIREDAKADFDFYVLSVFSAIVVTLGLIIDSGAVIIGGMLIAPLVWPILAMALGIIKGSIRLLETSFFTLAKATVVILIVAYIIGLLVPITDFGIELISRTEPTLFELFIALAAGFVGAFIITHPKLAQSFAGVVIAAALVPPVCVIGLSLAERSLTDVGGSLLLFLSNLIAVTVAAAVFFLLAKFETLSYSASKDRKKSNLIWSIVILIIIFIPLLIITGNTISDHNKITTANRIIKINLPDVEIVEIKINSIDDTDYIIATVKSPQNIRQYKMDIISDELAHEFESSVNFRVIVIPILEGGKVLDQDNGFFSDTQVQ